MSFWCPFLDPDLTMHHLNIGIHLRQVTKLGPLTLVDRKKVTHWRTHSLEENHILDLTRKQHNPHYI
jgi:hypothetical protein